MRKMTQGYMRSANGGEYRYAYCRTCYKGRGLFRSLVRDFYNSHLAAGHDVVKNY